MRCSLLLGKYLCYGRADGLFQFIDTNSLTNTMENTSFKWHNSAVKHITFNESSTHVVYTVSFTNVKFYLKYNVHCTN